MTDARPAIQVLGSGDAFGSGGRYQACIFIEHDAWRVLLDCGATSLTAMKYFGLDPGEIDAVVISHYHADHYGGIPFLVLDGQFSQRMRPLAIIGPGDVERRVTVAMETAFPGSSMTTRRFPLTFHELQVGSETRVEDATVLALHAAHTPGSDAVALRLSVGGASIAYSGDTEWISTLPELAAGADLLICESYTWQKRVPYHLDYVTFAAHRSELSAKRTVLTHLGPEMLQHLTQATEETARDGLRIAL
ncbi:MAG: MBL fold metallo-hydrolase [Candidatus Limnocylindria bacterium]